jgi:hypothetical protein
MYYHAISTNSTILEERRGQQFGPLVVVKVDDRWQIDHWPTGSRMAPWAFAPKLTYTRARTIASQLKSHPALQRKNLHLYWEFKNACWKTRCPQITDNIKALILQLAK